MFILNLFKIQIKKNQIYLIFSNIFAAAVCLFVNLNRLTEINIKLLITVILTCHAHAYDTIVLKRKQVEFNV